MSVISSSSVSQADISSAHDDEKFIYSFQEGGKEMKDLLGGKGANLSEMTKIGIPVPFGFTITTDVCRLFLDANDYPEGFASQLEKHLNELEKEMGKRLGDTEDPLLVSVRSGAAVSMPGMMDTVLNLGLNDETVKGLAKKTGNERFAYDSYRRFMQMFGNVVMEMDHHDFENILDALKEKVGAELDTDLTTEHLKELVESYKEIVKNKTGNDFPTKPLHQLKLAIEAVFNSWDNDRAIAYRRMQNIAGLKGTAVNIQAMVFGNMGEDSGTGVAFTRNPATGDKVFFGEFLMNAQGEDVVAGIRTPMNIVKMREIAPDMYKELMVVKDNLENHYKNMQDIEFTIEKGKLFLLQTRNGKRSAKSALKIAVDMVTEGLITKEEALLQIDAKSLNQLLHPQIKQSAVRNVITKGLPASPGAACGKIVFTSDDAMEMSVDKNEKVILVRKETSPEDISGMHISEGILTARGGMTSHAAVVCRGMGKCCVSGCNEIIVNVSAKKLIIGDIVLNEGDIITLDGSNGDVILGEMEMQEAELLGDFKTIMDWSDEFRKINVRTNADNPEDCKTAIEFGAEGVGLCRTEHMFFEDDRINLVRQMILSKNSENRIEPLKKLKEIQKDDFIGIFEAMGSLPVTVRLLDPPLHEFLPESESQIADLAGNFDMTPNELSIVVDNLKEINPMLGHRGCRLGITYPDIYIMQVQAIAEAAMNVSAKGERVNVEIEIPLIGDANELSYLRKVIQKNLDEYGDKINFDYKIGTMIEIPRACLTANKIAKEADFFSFGTNDLTQMTYGYSRDDLGSFVPKYLNLGILERDPMAGIDQDGVGALMQICIELGRKEKPDLEIGICGEQGGDPESVEFCHNIGLNFVSCSPYRVPIAKLAAAQAAIKKSK